MLRTNPLRKNRPPAPTVDPKQIMAQLKTLPGQTDWDEWLDSEEWILEAAKYPGFFPEAGVILYQRPVCTSEAMVEDCPGFHFHVDVRESLRVGMLMSHTYPCPFGSRKVEPLR